MSKNVKRLFSSFKPTNYKVDIELSKDKQSFSGMVSIHGVKTGRPSSRITLHAKSLQVTDITITHIDKKGVPSEITPARVVMHKAYDELRIHTSEQLYSGQYEININFSGLISKNMDGIYPSLFESDGVEKKLIVTQFESHHAREAFPCIDEPEAKATFQLQLAHASNEIALSNTPVLSSETLGDKTVTIFEPTPIMSTYLLAFIVGELEYKEAFNKNNIRIRTYSVPGKEDQTDFALETAVRAMDYYEEYYDIPFPLAKCDFVALPDFASGAMENWGLITFREQLLLCDINTSLSTKQYIAIVIAHELTHQWFGNLVTMRWWTDLWLNEGFASWMEYLATDELFPEWQLWTQFSVDEQQTALKADALEHTHPIEVPVHHPDEIRTIFDIISYQKGASVIHMLHDYLGPDHFREGIRHYLKKHAYKNTDTVDLWQALEDASQKPVKAFMGAWTSQSGFPLLTVSKNNNYLEISQSRFVTNPTSKMREDRTLWPVPLLAHGLDKVTVTKKLTRIPFAGIQPPIKINDGQTGFYRVDYSHDIQLLQIAQLDGGSLKDNDRMGLLSDGLETTKAGYQSVNEYLDLLSHYKNESSLAVWEIIAGSIGSIKQNLSSSDDDDTLRDILKPFTLELISLQLKRLTITSNDSESHLDTLLRPLIIGMAASADEKMVVGWAQDSFKAKIEQNKHINPDLRGIVYATIARLGSMTEYEALLKLYKNSSSADEKLSITAGMTSFKQPEIHAQIFSLIIDGTIRLQDVGYWIAYSFMNRHSKLATWEWVKDNWSWLLQNLGTDLSFSRMPVYAARSFTSNELFEDFKKFFLSNMQPSLDRSYKQGVEIIETQIAWRDRDAQKAFEWFKKPK